MEEQKEMAEVKKEKRILLKGGESCLVVGLARDEPQPES